MKTFCFFVTLLVAAPVIAQDIDVVVENNIVLGDPLLGDLRYDLGTPFGPHYDYEYIFGQEAEIVWQARAEVMLLGSLEFSMIKSSMRRASEKAEEGGLFALSEEIKRLVPVLPQPLPTFFSTPGEFTLSSNAPLVYPGTEKEVVNRNWLLKHAQVAYKASRDESDIKRKDALETCGRLLRRASLFYVRFGHSKGEACLLSQLFCRLHTPACWTECEIVAAQRIRDTTCARLGEYLTSWFPSLSPSLERWSTEKAHQLGGTTDLDVEACTVWLGEIRPILVEECGEEYVEEIYASPILRTYVWLLAARSMRCSDLLYWGDEQPLSRSGWISTLQTERVFISENLKALEYHINSMSIECCGGVRIDSRAPVIIEQTGIPVPVPIQEAPVTDCLPCQQGQTQRFVPRCGR